MLIRWDNFIAISFFISVQKNPETKELSIVSCVFKLTAKVSPSIKSKCMHGNDTNAIQKIKEHT
jgi:hypothetical protein